MQMSSLAENTQKKADYEHVHFSLKDKSGFILYFTVNKTNRAHPEYINISE